MPEKNERYSKLGLKILAMLPSYFDYNFVQLSTSQAQIKPEIFVNFMPESGTNPAKPEPEKPSRTYISASGYERVLAYWSALEKISPTRNRKKKQNYALCFEMLNLLYHHVFLKSKIISAYF